MQSRQARIGKTYSLVPTDAVRVADAGRRKSVADVVRRWGPFILTALVVPGGIAIVMLLLFRRWNQARQAVTYPVRA